MAQQVTKDGSGTKSQTGRWIVFWTWPTTATGDRTSYLSYFQWGVDFAPGVKDGRWRDYWFSYDNNFSTIEMEGSLCRP